MAEAPAAAQPALQETNGIFAAPDAAAQTVAAIAQAETVSAGRVDPHATMGPR